MKEITIARIAGAILCLSIGSIAEGAEIKVLAGAAFSPALAELGPQYERATGHSLKIQYGITGTLIKALDSGEIFDVVILPEGLLDAVAKKGKIVADTRTNIARVGMAIAVRVGAAKPSIGSVDEFKHALLNAKSVTYPPEGAIGIHLAKVLERLGIVEQMKTKTIPQKNVTDVPLAVAAGNAELGFAPSTVLISAAGVQFAGPFPTELQDYIVYVAGVGAESGQADAARNLLKHLTTPDAIALIRAKGLEVVGR